MVRLGLRGSGPASSQLWPSPLTLRFPGRWEATFYDDYLDNSLLLMRMVCLSMAAVALLYGVAIWSLFVDLVGFTTLSAKISPKVVVRMLNVLFSEFDRLATRCGLEKVNTIGDA